MGKTGVTLLSEASQIKSLKSKLKKQGILSDVNEAKLDKRIDRKVSSGIAVLNRRPKRASGGSKTMGLVRTTNMKLR